MNRGRKPTENEALNTGLATVEDPYHLADLRTRSLDELLNAVRHEVLYTVVAMARAGRLFMAMKEKVKHGEWEPYLDQHRIARSYARGCMKIVEIIARYPQAIHLPPGRPTHLLLNSSMSRVDAVLADLPEAAVKQLTPWDLERIYAKEKLKEKGPKKYTGPTDIELPTDLDKLAAKALSALNLLADLKLLKKEYPYALRYNQQLRYAMDRAGYNLRDPEHKTTPPWELGNRDDFSIDEDVEVEGEGNGQIR